MTSPSKSRAIGGQSPSLLRWSTSFVCLALSACGGGGGTGAGSTPVPATASVSTSWGTKTPWALSTNASFSLRDGSGAAVTGALTCTSEDSSKLEVASNCTTLTGKRLGSYNITVSAGAISARALVKVIPQPQPLGSSGTEIAGTLQLVVTQAGGLLAWGTNAGDMLGQGSSSVVNEFSSLPLPVKDASGSGELRNIVAASAGGSVALALTEDGEVFSWGSNGFGGLGRPVNGSTATPGKVVLSSGAALSRVVAISAGDDNALALLDDGTVASWGINPGHGDSLARANNPDLVAAVGGSPGAKLSNVVAVSAGVNWSTALMADGRIALWGFVNPMRFSPSQINVPVWLTHVDGQAVQDAVQISAGFFMGLAVTQSGQVLAWGTNNNGQLGQGGFLSSPQPTGVALRVKDSTGNGLLQNVSMVSAGSFNGLALTRDGQVLSWGYGQDGMLGDGANTPRLFGSSLPAPVVNVAGQGGALANVQSIASSLDHGLALQSDGRLLIWGQGTRGALGQGNANPSSKSHTPLTVKDASGNGTLNLGPMSYWPNLLQRGR